MKQHTCMKMPPRVPPRGSMNQASVFYSHDWPKDFDELFILGLCEQTGLGNFCGNGHANRKAINYAKDRVNGHNGTHLSYNFFLDRFRRLFKRYTVFKYIIEHPGVVHNERTHSVTADEGVWNRICRVHALAYAYMREGEGSYDSLEFIFTALPRVPDEDDIGVEIIEISSDHDTMSAGVDNSGVFDNDLAWYNSASSQSTFGMSMNVQDTGTSGPNNDNGSASSSERRCSLARRIPTYGPSSQASSSPFKPDY